MSRTFYGTLAAALLAAASALAQETPRQAAPAQRPGMTPAQKPPVLQTPATQQPTTPGQQTPAAARPSPPEPPAQPVNVKIDITITDQAGPGQPATRTVTMIVADRRHGSIRSTANQVQARMFVDAEPRILPNGNVQVFLGLEYNPRQALDPDQKPSDPAFANMIPQSASLGGSSLNQRITLILEPGKPLIISQAADPVSDRKITVEVRATLLK